MKDMIHVVSVGAEELIHRAYIAFLERHGCVLVVVRDHRGLPQALLNRNCDVAVLQATLSLDDLQETSRQIRQRWPKVRILIVRGEASCIDDALYDDRVEPAINPEHLLTTVERICSGRDVRSPLPVDQP